MKKLPPLDSVERCEKCGEHVDDYTDAFPCEYQCVCTSGTTIEFMLRTCPRCRYEWKEQIWKGEK